MLFGSIPEIVEPFETAVTFYPYPKHPCMFCPV